MNEWLNDSLFLFSVCVPISALYNFKTESLLNHAVAATTTAQNGTTTTNNTQQPKPM